MRDPGGGVGGVPPPVRTKRTRRGAQYNGSSRALGPLLFGRWRPYATYAIRSLEARRPSPTEYAAEENKVRRLFISLGIKGNKVRRLFIPLQLSCCNEGGGNIATSTPSLLHACCFAVERIIARQYCVQKIGPARGILPPPSCCPPFPP